MTTTTETRKARFRAALALAQMTAKAWAAEQGLAESHLYAVLSGARESASLTRKIDDFIATHLPEGAGSAA